MQSKLSVGAVLLCAACAGGGSGAGAPGSSPSPTAATVMKMAAKAEPPKPKDIDATGTYSVSLAYGGQPVGVTLEIAKQADGSLGGAIYADQVPAVPLTSVTVTGNRVQASLVTPDGANATLDFTIEGAALKGKWSASNGDGSEISGTKLP